VKTKAAPKFLLGCKLRNLRIVLSLRFSPYRADSSI
jgi:hypothetical protein